MTSAQSDAPNALQQLLPNAARGAIALAVYFVAECVVLTLGPRFVEPDAIVTAAVFRMSLLLLAGYLVVGAGLGALLGLLIAPLARRFPRASLARALALTLVLATTLHAAWALRPELSSGSIAFYALLALGVATVTTLARGRLAWLAAGMNPWTVTLMLVSAPVVRSLLLPNAYRTLFAAATIAYWLLLCGATHVIAAWLARRAPRSARASHLVLQGALAAAATVLTLGALSQIDPPRAGTFAARAARPATGGKRPNVVVLILDTVRSDHLSVFGYARKTTPFLERLAKEATIYPRHHGAADYTLPGHASIYTGMYPTQHGTYPHVAQGQLYATPLAEHFTTLAEALAGGGYRTASIVANHGFLGPGFGLLQGFEHYSARVPVPMLPRVAPVYLRSAMRELIEPFASTADFDLLYRRGGEINADVLGTLDNLAHTREPFLLVANYMDAHDPYEPPAPYSRLFPGRARTFHYAALRAAAESVLKLERDFAPWEREHMLSQYDGALAYLDHCIEEVVGHLRKLGVYDDTLLVVTSDHGEAFGEHSMAFHGAGSVYEDQVHVPLIIKYPGRAQGQVYTGLASHVDILPTVLDVAGVPVPAEAQGHSLRDASASTDTARVIVSEASPERECYELHPRLQQTRKAVYVGERKLIRSSTGKLELYDLARDPAELHDLAPSDPASVAALSQQLAAAIGARPAARAQPGANQVGADAIKRLRALGYVK